MADFHKAIFNVAPAKGILPPSTEKLVFENEAPGVGDMTISSKPNS